LQILGDKGHGKTTTLLALTERFKQQGRRVTYEHLEVEADHFTTALEGLDGFVLDEAQRLTAGERQRLLRAGLGRLVLAGHEDLTPLFTKFNLALTTVRFDTTTLAHLRAVVARRLEFFAMPEANGWVTVSAEALTYLYKTFGADVRRSEQALYEAFVLARDREGLTEIGIAELPV
jgi:chromosomal replication initiation ATPase DnaA